MTREAFYQAGGFTEGLTANHQTEFALRVFPICRAEGWKVGAIDVPLVHLVLAAPADRPRNNPERLMASAVYLVEHHGEQLTRSPDTLADYLTVAGVAASACASVRRRRGSTSATRCTTAPQTPGARERTPCG